MKYEITCKYCENKFLHKRPNRLYCNRNCQNKDYKKRFSGENNPAFGKTYRTKETHPEWANKVSETHKERGHLVGEKNPMKRKDVAIKMGKTRSAKFQSDPEFRKLTSERVSNAWREGKYDNVKVGKCMWFTHQKPNGDIIKLQGKWELAYAKWLDSNNVEYTAHRGRIPYIQNDVNRSYYPDFYLHDENVYVDIKNEYHYSLNEEKFELIREQNPHINLKLLFKIDLLELGVEI